MKNYEDYTIEIRIAVDRIMLAKKGKRELVAALLDGAYYRGYAEGREFLRQEIREKLGL
jgi:hypothetical protein